VTSTDVYDSRNSEGKHAATVLFATGTGSLFHIKLAGGNMVRMLSKHDDGGVKVDVNAITSVG
jgi:hypothetical protein